MSDPPKRHLKDKYKNLWLRLTELFPDLQTQVETNWTSLPVTARVSPINFEALHPGEAPLYHEEHSRVWGYMVWTIRGIKPSFWEKVVLPLLEPFGSAGVCWMGSTYDDELFHIRIPAQHNDVIAFRRWAAVGIEFDNLDEEYA